MKPMDFEVILERGLASVLSHLQTEGFEIKPESIISNWPYSAAITCAAKGATFLITVTGPAFTVAALRKLGGRIQVLTIREKRETGYQTKLPGGFIGNKTFEDVLKAKLRYEAGVVLTGTPTSIGMVASYEILRILVKFMVLTPGQYEVLDKPDNPNSSIEWKDLEELATKCAGENSPINDGASSEHILKLYLGVRAGILNF